MRDRDYYPAGAYDDPNAPYNQCDPPDHDFEALCSQTLSKSDSITTNKYNLECSCDEDGCYKSYDTSDIDWSEEWHENDHYTPLQLIGILSQCLNTMLEQGLYIKSIQHTKHLIEECKDWQEDETEYMEN